MVEFQDELLYVVLGEIQPLAEAHHAELKKTAPLAVQWAKYGAMEAAGNLVVFSARQAGALVGYAFFCLGEHVHYGTTKTAQSTALYLHPSVRNGFTLRRMVRYCESALSKLGAQELRITINLHKDFRPLLYPLGYENEETVVTKKLRGIYG